LIHAWAFWTQSSLFVRRIIGIIDSLMRRKERGTRWSHNPCQPHLWALELHLWQAESTWRVHQVFGSPWLFHSSSDNRTWPTAHQAQQGLPGLFCCSAILWMCNRSEISRVGVYLAPFRAALRQAWRNENIQIFQDILKICVQWI
jgi:hypothetical protein